VVLASSNAVPATATRKILIKFILLFIRVLSDQEDFLVNRIQPFYTAFRHDGIVLQRDAQLQRWFSCFASIV